MKTCRSGRAAAAILLTSALIWAGGTTASAQTVATAPSAQVAAAPAVAKTEASYLAWVNWNLTSKLEKRNAAELDAATTTQMWDLYKTRLSDAEARAYATLPRLTIQGGTAAQRAKVKSRLNHYGIKVAKGTKVTLVKTVSGAAANVVGIATMHVPRTVVLSDGWIITTSNYTNIRIKLSAVTAGGHYLDSLVIHEVAHAAESAVQGGDPAAASAHAKTVWPTQTKVRALELETDCMVWVKAGKAVANRQGSYLQLWNKTCNASQLNDARKLWSRLP
jgi:hypothetical protein